MKYLIEKNGYKYIEERSGGQSEPPHSIGIWTFGDSEDPRWVIAVSGVLEVDYALKATVESQDAADAVTKAKSDAIYNEYVTLNNVVLTEASVKLFAQSPESATANYLELLMMRDSPSLFSSEGLLAEVDVKESDLITKIIDKGEPLDTDQKCLDYATRLIEVAAGYAVYRHRKKDEFRAYKESL